MPPSVARMKDTDHQSRVKCPGQGPALGQGTSGGEAGSGMARNTKIN